MAYNFVLNGLMETAKMKGLEDTKPLETLLNKMAWLRE